MTTRSGLVVSPCKKIPRRKKVIDINSLLPCAITRPVPFSLKPYASLYNPYARGCSILCNHPKRGKKWNMMSAKTTPTYVQQHHVIDIPDHVPEEFFRRFTDTDSRPLTPTPSCATSARTRGHAMGASHLGARRCVTPEPVRNEQERKQIILDLRRSHSQETLYWNASSEFSHPGRQDSTSSSWMPQPTIKHEIELIGTSQNPEIDDIAEMEEEEIEYIFHDIINETEDLIDDPTMSCIYARDDEDDELIRRRGKLRRKKSKSSLQVITFQPSNEPETHVAQIDDGDPDSPNLSSRHSLVPDSAATAAAAKSARKDGNEDLVQKNVFHTDDLLKSLKMGLNVDVVECVFDRYRHRTLQEAFRTISPERLGMDSDAVREMKDSLNLEECCNEKWQHLPRRFSRSSARFELPIDIREMSKLKPFNYLSKYVYVDSDKKQLYHRVFVKYLPKSQMNREEAEHDDLYANLEMRKAFMESLLAARVMPIDKLNEALHKVLGFHATDENVIEIEYFLELDKLDNDAVINFRTFCGIVSFGERMITTLSQEDDPRDEIEVADFETMLARHFDKIESPMMKRMFEVIQK